MSDFLLNMISLGIKPLYEKQRKFDDLITEFRERFANPARAGMIKSDIDEFYKRLNDFDFGFVFFKGYYRKYIENLNRFKPDVDNPDLTFLRIALTKNKWKPTKPYPVFVHHLKYEFKLTANPFISHQKKQQRKKLDALGVTAKENAKTKSQNWTRVPINQSKNES